MTTQISCMVSPTSTTAALLAVKIQRGFYMGGIIYPDQRSCKCGGKFISKTFRGQSYYTCEKCDKDPELFRVRRYLPGPFGEKGKTVEIRYDSNGKRLTSIQAAHATMEYIDGLINSGKFDPSEFMIKEANNMLIFDNFVNKKYLPFNQNLVERGEISPSTLIAKKQYLRNHLLPHFGKKNIKAISSGSINEFTSESRASSSLMRDILGELKRILNYARSIEMVEIVPVFPKVKKSKLKDAELFLTWEQQLEVIEHIDNEQYKVMIQLLCYTGMRPCEVRSLRWSDWDFKTSTLWIKRHTTINAIERAGRKSTDDFHTLPITPEMMKFIENLPRPIDQNEPMFKGKVNKLASTHCLSRAWAKAIKLTKIPYVDLYRGSKSSRLSQMLRAGFTEAQISQLAGISTEVVKRYAQHNNESKRQEQIKLLKMGE
jgi:integrase